MRAWVIIMLIVFNTATALVVVDYQYRKRLAVIALEKLAGQHKQAVDKHLQLSAEYATLSAPERIERIAMERLNMKYEYGQSRYLRVVDDNN